MIQDCHVYYDNENPEYCILCLPGRGQEGSLFARYYRRITQYSNTLFVGPTPVGLQWYPMPFSSIDQDEAVAGLPKARQAVEAVLKAVVDRFHVPRSKTIITGFSAGGVMAIETATYSDEPFAAVICHNGAILETKDLPLCKHKEMPILLIHNKDDECFSWEERFVPMKTALLNNGYLTYTIENDHGGHYFCFEDIEEIVAFMEEKVPQKFAIRVTK